MICYGKAVTADLPGDGGQICVGTEEGGRGLNSLTYSSTFALDQSKIKAEVKLQ